MEARVNTIYGPAIGDGLAMKTTVRQGQWTPLIERSFWSTPLVELRSRQAATIPITVGHEGQPVGHVVHLEVTPHKPQRLVAVAEIDDRIDLGDEDIYWSATTQAWQDGRPADVRIHSLALVARSAQQGLRPLKLLAGDLSYRAAPQRWKTGLTQYDRELLARAAETVHARRDQPGQPLYVHDEQHALDLERLDVNERYRLLAHQHDDRSARPHGRLEIRPAGRIISVR